MSETDTALHDEEVFSDELPDAVLEVAGGKCWEGPASSVTIGFCSGPENLPYEAGGTSAPIILCGGLRRISPSCRLGESSVHKITMSRLLALCGLALLVQHVFDLEPLTGDHLVAGVLMLTATVIVKSALR